MTDRGVLTQRSAPTGRSRLTGRWRAVAAGFAGVLAAAIALGVGELVAVYVRPEAAPIVAVGNRVAELSPEPWTLWAIRTFGHNDKNVLIAALIVLLALLAAGVGLLAGRRLEYGLAGVAVFAAWGAYCAATAHGARGTDVVPVLVGAAAAAGVLWALLYPMSAVPASPASPAAAGGPTRSAFLAGAGGLAALAAVTGFGGRWWQHRRFDVSRSRSEVAARLPVPDRPAPDPVGADLLLTDHPWQTPNDEFYRVDTVLTVPQVKADGWTLRIHGMVERELTLTWEQLLARPMVERWITLACVSNGVGGPYVGNARWLGTSLTDLLREAGVLAGADQLLMSDVHGVSIGAPAKVVMDGRDALLAIAMNGEPLPPEHGFPVRVVVPGLYGYVSACKWITQIEATTYAKKAYWVERGWVAQPTLELMSRIDTPRENNTLAAGRQIPVAGVAWDQHVGISAVEVQVDDGPWQHAGLAPAPTSDTWRQWVWQWTPTPGVHTLRVRATDAHGRPQVATEAAPFPAGATGYHQVAVRAQ